MILRLAISCGCKFADRRSVVAELQISLVAGPICFGFAIKLLGEEG